MYTEKMGLMVDHSEGDEKTKVKVAGTLDRSKGSKTGRNSLSEENSADRKRWLAIFGL